MTTAAEVLGAVPIRMLLTGYPGAGKTGALASLANAGYKIRVLAFDKMANMLPLIQYTKPEFHKNISFQFCEDKLRSGQRFIETSGVPTAFVGALEAMKDWKETAPDGTVTTLGNSKDWGRDTIVVLDSITSQGDAAMRRAMVMGNKTPLNRNWQTWGFAASDQDQFVELVASNNNQFHFIALSHLKPISPEEIDKDDNEVNKELKTRMANLMPTRLYPTAVGRQLPQNFARHFSVALMIENVVRQGKVKKVIHTAPRPELDLKVPAPNLPPELDISTGLLEVFKACGQVPPAEEAKGKPNG